MFYQIFLSPQVKRCAIITNMHGIHLLMLDWLLADLILDFVTATWHEKPGNSNRHRGYHRCSEPTKYAIAQTRPQSPPPHVGTPRIFTPPPPNTPLSRFNFPSLSISQFLSLKETRNSYFCVRPAHPPQLMFISWKTYKNNTLKISRS